MGKINNNIVEGVMNRVLDELGRVHWNKLQKPWGRHWDAPYTPMVWNTVTVEIEKLSDGDGLSDLMMHVIFDGIKVSTWLDSKREYSQAYYPERWTPHDFIDWAEKVFDAIV